MSRRQKSPASASRARAAGGPAKRRWLRWLSAALAPLLAFGLLEMSLQIAGFGYPTQFLLESVQGSRRALIQNNDFSRRFLGSRLARVPCSFSLPVPKPPNTVRVFVFGESAAMGDPMPPFGLPRVLQALFELRYPGVHFEFVNAAMTGINSHAILQIARDCARADGDVWVIYMGNNEVVGPFGAGTVFGPQSPPQSLIRASLALKTTRVGQLLDELRQSAPGHSKVASQWTGMQMFLDQQIAANDPRMTSVYNHFTRNLEDMIRVGREAGVGIVLSTVAVNLKDCAPFASAHRRGLSTPDRKQWDALFQTGVQVQEAGDLEAAAVNYREAARIDSSFAELRYRNGQCALGLGRTQEAGEELRAARDLDTLRFRCDSRLNDLIRQSARSHGSDRVRLADSEQIFAQNSTAGVPGSELFYEHVHLTFEGTYLLARIIAGDVDALMPDWVRGRAPTNSSWASLSDCARRLAWTDTSRAQAYQDILGRLQEAPFTAQADHATQIQRIHAALDQLIPAVQPGGVQAARKVCEAAVAAFPEDPSLRAQLGFYQRMTGDNSGADASVRRALELLPNDAASWSQLALLLVQQGKPNDAIPAFDQALALNPRDAGVLQDLAVAKGMVGQTNEAMRDYRRVVEIRPNFGMAWVGLGRIYESRGEKAEAEKCYRRAFEPPMDPLEMASLARFCLSRGWLEGAATNYQAALEREPLDLRVRVEAGETFASMKKFDAAAEQFRMASRLNPDSGQVWYRYGTALLMTTNNPSQAVNPLRNAVRLMPAFVPARLNLAMSLVKSGRDSEALVEFERVLERDPANSVALASVAALTSRGTTTNTPPKP